MNSSSATSAFSLQAQARPLLAWSDQQIAGLRDVLHRLLLDWQSAWSLAGDGAEVRLETTAASHQPDDGLCVTWRLVGSPAHGAQVDALSRIEACLFSADAQLAPVIGQASRISREVCKAAWADWLTRWTLALGAPLQPSAVDHVYDAQTSADAFALNWSGDLVASMSWCQASWVLFLPGKTVQGLLQAAGLLPIASAPPAKPGLADLADALQSHTLSLRAGLSPVMLSLGELENLAIGDVLVLGHEYSAPLQVLGPRDEVLCHAWLGQQSGRVALELSQLPE